SRPSTANLGRSRSAPRLVGDPGGHALQLLQDRRRALPEQLVAERLAERARLGGGAAALAADDLLAVHRRDEGAQRDLPRGDGRVRRDGHLAAALEAAQEPALRLDALARLGVIERREAAERRRVAA